MARSPAVGEHNRASSRTPFLVRTRMHPTPFGTDAVVDDLALLIDLMPATSAKCVAFAVRFKSIRSSHSQHVVGRTVGTTDVARTGSASRKWRLVCECCHHILSLALTAQAEPIIPVERYVSLFEIVMCRSWLTAALAIAPRKFFCSFHGYSDGGACWLFIRFAHSEQFVQTGSVPPGLQLGHGDHWYTRLNT